MTQEPVPREPSRVGLHPDLLPGARWDVYGRRLCTAHKRDGALCESPAVKGLRVCRMHGGSSQAARRKAKLRLMELVDPAIQTLAREMTTAPQSADRQRAANSILDRSGWGRVTRVETADARDELVRRLLELRDQQATPGRGLTAISGSPRGDSTGDPGGDTDDEDEDEYYVGDDEEDDEE